MLTLPYSVDCDKSIVRKKETSKQASRLQECDMCVYICIIKQVLISLSLLWYFGYKGFETEKSAVDIICTFYPANLFVKSSLAGVHG